MTREEMIEQLENTILLIKQNAKDWWDDRDIPVLEEAIKAMQTEHCEDCISRQAAIDALRSAEKHGFDAYYNNAYYKGLVRAHKIIEDLPSVQPEPFINKPCVSEGVCHEDKMKVLEKIRAEIEQITDTMGVRYNQYVSKIDVLQIIDKYMAEREVKE